MASKLLFAACEDYFPDQGLNLGPLNWEGGVLAIGPPGESLTPLLSSSQQSFKETKFLLFKAKEHKCPESHNSLSLI